MCAKRKAHELMTFEFTDNEQAKNERPEYTLGYVLVSSGLISRDELDVALEVAHGLGVKLGQVLSDTNKISIQDLENALTAKCLMDSGYYDPMFVSEALRTSHANNTAFAQVIFFS